MDGYANTVAPTVVNGINLDDLFALIEGIRTDPAKAKTHWRVATTWQGQTRSRAEVEGFGIGGAEVPRRFAIDIDEPYELGGSNRFANPQEHLIAALNACMTVGYVECAVRAEVIRYDCSLSQADLVARSRRRQKLAGPRGWNVRIHLRPARSQLRIYLPVLV